MKRYLTFFFLFITSLALCAYPEGAINNIDGSALGWDETNKVWRPIAVDANGKLGTGDSSTIQEISVDTSNIDNKLVATFTSAIYPYTSTNKTAAEMLKEIMQILQNDAPGTSICTLITNIFNGQSMMLSNVQSISQSLENMIPPQFFYTSRLSINANSATAIDYLPSSTAGKKRVFVELRAIDPDDEFYIGFDNTVTDSTGRPVKGRILLNIPSLQSLYVYHTNSSALAIQQTEGWR